MMPNRISGDMVLHTRPPAVQNVLKIPLKGALLAQGRNAPPHRQRAAEIGVGIVLWEFRNLISSFLLFSILQSHREQHPPQP